MAPVTGGTPMTIPGIRAGGTGAACARSGPGGSTGRVSSRKSLPMVRLKSEKTGWSQSPSILRWLNRFTMTPITGIPSVPKSGTCPGVPSSVRATCWWHASHLMCMPGWIKAITGSAKRLKLILKLRAWIKNRSAAKAY